MGTIEQIKKLGLLDENSITMEEITRALHMVCNFMNEEEQIQEQLIGKDLRINMNLKEVGSFNLTIQEGYAEYGLINLDLYDFALTSDVDVMFKLLTGKIDPIQAYFSEKFLVKGDFYYIIEFFQIMEFITSTFFKEEKLKPIIDSNSLKELFDVYARGTSVLKPIHIPLFFEILTAFANNNSKAKKLLLGEDLVIQMNILNFGHYFIRIVDNKVGWAIGDAPNPNIKFEMGFKTSAEVIFERNPINAFMRGEIKVAVRDNDWFKVFILKDLTDLLLEFLKI